MEGHILSPFLFGNVLRWIPLILLLSLMGLTFHQGWHRALTLEAIGDNYTFFRFYIGQHYVLSLFIYILIYVVVVTLSLPAGFPLTVSGGLLFGWKIGAPAAIFAATLGATLLFEIAKTSLGKFLVGDVTPWLEKLQKGFHKNALSYLLFLRLVAIFPFFVVNLASAFLNVPLKTFVLGTFLGITPATFVFSYAGSGLGSFIESQNAAYLSCLERQKMDIGLMCPYQIDTSHLLTNEVLISFILLGFMALLPIVLKRTKNLMY